MYKIVGMGVKRLSDGASILPDAANTDWQTYQEWLAAGNKPESEYSLGELKKERQSFINIERDRRLNAGVVWNGYQIDSDINSRNNLMGTISAINAGVSLPQNFVWRTSDNLNIPITNEQLINLGETVLNYISAVYQRSWELKDLILAATTPEELDLISWGE